MKNYKKKPVTVQAIQLIQENQEELEELFKEKIKGKISFEEKFNRLCGNGRVWASIKTLEGTMYAHEYDWIIRGVKGEFYSCKPDIFKLTYEVDSE